jgi:DNA end-binding protein Ku
MTDNWHPESYHDDYRDDLMALIKKKIKTGHSQTITEPDPEKETPRPDNVIDLMKLLKRSVDETGKGSVKTHAARKKDTRSTKKAPPVKRRAKARE